MSVFDHFVKLALKGLTNCRATITLMMTKKLTLSIRLQIFDFLDVPSFVSLFNGNQNESLYFVKVTEKDTAQKDLTDTYGHFIGNGERLLKGYYLKLSRSKHISKKKFLLLPTPIVFAADEVFDTFVEITEALYVDTQYIKLLIQKANSYK